MDSNLVQIQNQLPDSAICLSCDLGDSSCFEFAMSHKVYMVPWLAVFVGEQHVGDIRGVHEPEELKRELIELIANGDPA